MYRPVVKKTICPLDCPDSCGLVAHLVNGRVAALAGDPDHPYTAGSICRKMRRYPERVYSPERVLYPGIRVGTKGEGKFARISWDEALSLLAERLLEIRDRDGGQAILRYSYAGNMGHLNRFAGHALFHKLGATHLEETICSAAAAAGWDRQCGPIAGSPPEKAAEAELIVAWGINIRVTNQHFWRYVATARKRGGQLLVIDPYRNATAAKADHYLPVKPAGDSALALGLIKALDEAGLLERERLARTSTGFVRLEDSLRRLGWEEIVRESGLARELIEQLARRLAGTPRLFFRLGIGLSRNSRGGMAVRAIASLAACLGLFDGGPGRGILLSSRAFRGDTARLTYPELAPPGGRRVNMVQLGHALNRLEPPLRALVVYNSNPASVAPDGAMVRQGLAREDLFTVVHEQLLTPTALYADLLLPATTFLENRDLYTAYGHFYLGVVAPVIAPLGEARSNFDFFQDLARVMGFTDPPFRQTLEERLSHYLEGLQGIPAEADLATVLSGTLVKSTFSHNDGPCLAGGRFPFVSGDDQLSPAVASLLPAGEFDDPDLQTRYPYRLLSPPHPGLLNSTFGERFPGEIGELLVHPDDAAHCRLEDGAEVLLQNHRGGSVRRVRVSTATQPGVVVAEGIFWSESAQMGGINDLTSQRVADLGGGATFHEARVAMVPYRRESAGL
jgi:anaerobic selenocysteine-containing dehydrogenase